MNSYKIYAGNPLEFQHIKYNCTLEEALEEAKNLAIDLFESSEDFPEVWDDCIFAAESILDLELDLEENDKFYDTLLFTAADQIYLDILDDFLNYDVQINEE